jgi:tyrosyl-tRNA synthetase
MDLLDDLSARGLVYQQTDADGLRRHLAEDRRSLYAGLDPTRDSLTIGHLVPLLMLARFQRAGHRPIAVMGGGTGLIGDPSFKATERPMLTREQVEHNVARIRENAARILETSGPNAALFLNNADWLEKLSFVDALRDIGKHFSVNAMVQRDSVRERLQNREQGISYTEFSYMLLQAYDFLYLYRSHGVTLQAAGSDQWGNVVAGIELIRRTERIEAFGLTNPLVLKADGTKFGKTETGAVWLSPDRTSPYAFYQFWLNTADADIEKYLKFYTFLPVAEIEGIAADHAKNPGARAAQRLLAEHVTRLVHGDDALAQAAAATRALFSGEVAGLSKATLEEVFASASSSTLPKSKLDGEGAILVELLVEADVAKSKREAREFLEQGAIQVNGERAGLDARLTSASLLHGEVVLVRRGKKSWHVLRFQA